MSVRDTLTDIVRQWAVTYAAADYLGEQIADAYRAEVLREAADVVGPRCEEYGILGVDNLLRRMADARKDTAPSGESTQPAGFFQPGRTYTSPRGEFRCTAITTHPVNREQRAVGWSRQFGSDSWDCVDLDQDDWSFGDRTEVREAGDAR